MNRPSNAAHRRSRTVIAKGAPYAFSTIAQRDWLTPRGFTLLQAAVADGHGLGEDLAHEVARALRGWAASRGATHVAFRVHALDGGTSEYRLELPLLTGQDLVGGTRAGAPGRLTWDPASPAYLRVDARGAMLCLPSVLASPSGEALDHRLPLMRSEDALAAAAERALRVLGDAAGVRVQATVALTRGFELVDIEPHVLRTTADRTMACTVAAERDLDRVAAGVRIGCDELTVLPTATGLAADRLALAWEVLGDVAPRYGLRLRPRDAGPDAWSLMAGNANLLAPGATPRAHLRFVFFVAAVVRAFAAHRDLVEALDLGADLRKVLGALARGALFAGSDEERAFGAPSLPRVAGRATAYGFTGAGFALGELDPFAATVVNTIVAEAVAEQTRALEAWTAAGEDREPAVREVVADAYRRHRHGERETGHAEGRATWGAGASEAVAAPWPAARVSESAVRVFAEQAVMSARELSARYEARAYREARAAVERARAYVTPAAVLRRTRTSAPRATPAIDEAVRTVQAASRALDAMVAAGDAEGVPPLLEDLRAATRRLAN